MSTIMLGKCWPLIMPPAAKSVLISMADNANDSGFCWPSLSYMCVRTCFGKSAIIEAIKWLEAHGAICADRSMRYRTTYRITPTSFRSELVRQPDMSATDTSPPDELVRQPEFEVRQPEFEVRQPDTNHQEPSRTGGKEKKARQVEPPPELPDWLPADAWADWCTYRKAKAKAGWTKRAQELSIARLDQFRKRGHEPRAVIELAIVSGWQGLYEPKPEGPAQGMGMRPRPSRQSELEERNRRAGEEWLRSQQNAPE